MLGHEDVRQAEEMGSWKGRPFIITYTKKVFPYDEMSSDNIDIRDIAHSLSQLCRWTGHTSLFYSVAQHSLLVSEKMPGGPAGKLAGLLHDGAEAYTNDLSSPLKRWMQDDSPDGCSYAQMQDTIAAMIYTKYGVTTIPPDVRLYDIASSVFEAEGLLGLSNEELRQYDFPTETQGLWQPWEPHYYAATNTDLEMGAVETQFLRRFEMLMDQLGRDHAD